MEKLELSYAAGRDIKCCTHFGKYLSQFLKKLNIELPYEPAVPLLGTYPKELRKLVHTRTCTQMFLTALFIIAKRWKQLKYPLTGGWINKMGFHLTTEYYSAINRNEILVLQNRWTLKTLCHVKEARYRRPHNVWFHFYERSKTGKSIRPWLATAGGKEGMGCDC